MNNLADGAAYEQSVDRKLAFAEFLRGTAAVLVLICHYVQIYWGSRYSTLLFTNANILPESVYPTPLYIPWIYENPLIRNGSCGVGIFFLLSGFVIVLSLEKYERAEFIVGRFFRLYPTYICGFSITLAVIAFSGVIFGNPFPHSVREILLQYAVGLRTIFGSKNIDGVSWTLEIEVQFYTFVSIFYTLFKNRSKKLVYVIIGAIISAGLCAMLALLLAAYGYSAVQDGRLFILGITDVKFFCFMLIGAMFAFHRRGDLTSVRLFSATVILLASFLSLWAIDNSLGDLGQPSVLMTAYLLAFLIFSVCYSLQKHLNFDHRITRWLASVSYPLYVVHMPAGFLMMRLLHGMMMSPLLTYLITISLVIGMSYAIHVGVEVPFQRLGRRWATNASKRCPSLRKEVRVTRQTIS